MNKSRVVVEKIARFEPPGVPKDAGPLEGLTVYFMDGQTAQLDRACPRSGMYADILNELRRQGSPVYVAVDFEGGGYIRELLIPFLTIVNKVTAMPSGDVEVELELSHARHRLSREAADFGTLFDILRIACEAAIPLFITDTLDDHEIIHVREAEEGLERQDLPSEPDLRYVLPVISLDWASRLFQEVVEESCDPRTLEPHSCIPFLYPDNGCWARADEACRIIVGNGGQPGKLWIMDKLKAPVRSHPNCECSWSFHVAAALKVLVDGVPEIYLIDPTLFPGGPVSSALWISKLGSVNENAALTDQSTSYHPEKNPIILAQCRMRLRLRSFFHGPPPYCHCQEPETS